MAHLGVLSSLEPFDLLVESGGGAMRLSMAEAMGLRKGGCKSWYSKSAEHLR